MKEPSLWEHLHYLSKVETSTFVQKNYPGITNQGGLRLYKKIEWKSSKFKTAKGSMTFCKVFNHLKTGCWSARTSDGYMRLASARGSLWRCAFLPHPIFTYGKQSHTFQLAHPLHVLALLFGVAPIQAYPSELGMHLCKASPFHH